MSDKQIKWLILIIPTIVIGLWEYIRHEYLLPYISMEVGNWLSPIIVFFVTMTFLVALFRRYEQLQDQLEKEKMEKAVLQERERIAREFHDGIAQSLFLCSVQTNQMRKKQPTAEEWAELDKNLRQMHDYVRFSISNLKSKPAPDVTTAWKLQIEELIKRFRLDTGIEVEENIYVHESDLSPKEKIKLLACIQEAFTNIRKHAHATHVQIDFFSKNNEWFLEIVDNGQGFQRDPFDCAKRFGMKIMRDRVQEIGANLFFSHQQGKTKLVIKKVVG